MKIQELMEKLKKCNPDEKVCVALYNEDEEIRIYEIDVVFIDENDVSFIGIKD